VRANLIVSFLVVRPAFEWTAKWEDVHEGQPALWNFDWVVHDSNANRS
jgi:hypothetical protein